MTAALAPASTACDHAHAGPHLLMWNTTWGSGDLSVAETVERTANHAAAVGDADEADVEVFETVLARVGALPVHAAPIHSRVVECDDDEYRAVREVLVSGAEYMAANRYADDEDFPEDAFTARVVGPAAAGVLACWADRLH